MRATVNDMQVNKSEVRQFREITYSRGSHVTPRTV